MVFVDADEYLVVPDGRPLPEVLEPYSDFGGLAVNWRWAHPCWDNLHQIMPVPELVPVAVQ